ncbi:MAG: hypothetical protein KDD37_08585, partial [Bdellovibrionales bacterium]|nr:hypothetical protein [Bdellovibrionales bacterium]
MRYILCLIMIFVLFQNCSEIDLVPLKATTVDSGSTTDTGNGGDGELPPSPAIPTTNKILVCKGENVNGKLKYTTDVINLATSEIETTIETGNCRSQVVADLNADGNQDWLNANWNSTINPCMFQVFDAKTNALTYERLAPGTVAFSSDFSMCTGELKLYSSPSQGDRLIYSYEQGVSSQKGYQILAGQELTTEYDEVFPYFESLYVFSYAKDINGDAKPEAWSSTSGSYDNIIGFSGFGFAFLNGSIPYSNILQSLPLPVNQLPHSAYSLEHPNLPPKHILNIDVEEMIPYSGGGLINSSKELITKLYSDTLAEEQSVTVSNVKIGNSNYQYQYLDKADFNGDLREDAIFMQYTGTYSTYIDVRSGNDLSLLLKINRLWLVDKINNTNISESVIYMGALDFNDDGKTDIALKYYSYDNGGKTFLVIIGLDGQVFFTKEL